jgi:hypothetical protein
MAVRWEGLGVANAWRTIPASMCIANGEIWRRWHYSVGVFFMERTIYNAEGYKDILTRYVLSTVEDQFGDDDCLYQHDSAPCHKARSVRGWSVDNKVPEMDCRIQSPDLNPTEHLWNELESRLRSRPQRPTSLSSLATTLQEE